MKRVLIYVGIGIGSLVALFIISVISITIIADGELERQQFAYTVGFAFGILLIFVTVGVILFVAYRLTLATFKSRKKPEEEQILGKDDPIDRYLK